MFSYTVNKPEFAFGKKLGDLSCPSWIVVDYSNLAYISFFANAKAEDVIPDGYTKHIETFHEKITRAINSFGMDTNCLIFAEDCYPKVKKELLPEYKTGRQKIEFDVRGTLTDNLKFDHYYFAKTKDFEADDVIATLVQKNPTKNILVITTDKDIWQILSHHNCNIYNPVGNEIITREHLEKKFKLDDFKQIALHKALWGDSSDKIPNLIPRMQKQLLPLVKQTTGNLAEFFRVVKANRDNLTKRCVELLDENEDKLITNYTMAKLNANLEVKIWENKDQSNNITM